MSKNRVLPILVATVFILSALLFAACKAEEAPPVEEEAPPVEEEAPPVEEAWKWPEKLYLLSQGAATADYAVATAWSTPLGQDTGMTIRLVSEDNEIVRWRWMKENRFFDYGLSVEPNVFLEAKGDRATRDAGPYQIRIWWPHGKGGFGFAVRGDSKIKVPSDIKPGTRLVYMPFLGAAGQDPLKALLAWAQVGEDKVEWIPAGSITAATAALMEGKGDIGLGYPISATWVEAEAGPYGLRWIALDAKKDPQGAARFLAVYPTARFGIYAEQGVKSAWGVPMIVTLPRYAMNAATDPELVYQMVKWLVENHDKYKDAHPYCKFMTVDTLMEMAETDYVPLHDGTVKYLQEKGVWTPAHEARRQQQIQLINSYIEAYQKAIAMADEKGYKVDPTNKDWTELWENYKTQLGLPAFKFFTGLD